MFYRFSSRRIIGSMLIDSIGTILLLYIASCLRSIFPRAVAYLRLVPAILADFNVVLYFTYRETSRGLLIW
jgi:hypothetical protein